MKPEENITFEESLEKIAPNLSKISRKSPFKIPVDYFDELPVLIQERIMKHQKSIQEKLFELLFKKIMMPGIALAAIILASLLITDFSPQQNQISLNIETSQEILDEYDLDEYLITESLAIDNSTTLMDAKIVVNTTIYEDEVIDYLIDNEIEITEIITYL